MIFSVFFFLDPRKLIDWAGRVFLHATDESALSNGVTLDLLKKFAAEGEAQGGGQSLEKKVPIEPGKKDGIARETH